MWTIVNTTVSCSVTLHLGPLCSFRRCFLAKELCWAFLIVIYLMYRLSYEAWSFASAKPLTTPWRWGRSQSLTRRKNFTSWRGCLPESVSLNWVKLILDFTWLFSSDDLLLLLLRYIHIFYTFYCRYRWQHLLSNRQHFVPVIRIQAFSYDFNFRSNPWPSRKLVPVKH